MPKETVWIERELLLAEITLSDDLKVRDPDKAVIAKYAKGYADAPEGFPPLKAAQIKGAYYLVDGWHRFFAAQRAGLNSLPVLTAKLSQPQAAAEAAKANTKHGRGVSGDAEKSRIIDMYFSDPANLVRPVRSIAGDLPGIVSKSQAQRILAKMKSDTEPAQKTWDADKAEQAAQDLIEQHAIAAVRTLETHWNRITSPQVKRHILQIAQAAVAKLSGEAAELPESPLDI